MTDSPEAFNAYGYSSVAEKIIPPLADEIASVCKRFEFSRIPGQSELGGHSVRVISGRIFNRVSYNYPLGKSPFAKWNIVAYNHPSVMEELCNMSRYAVSCMGAKDLHRYYKDKWVWDGVEKYKQLAEDMEYIVEENKIDIIASRLAIGNALHGIDRPETFSELVSLSFTSEVRDFIRSIIRVD